MLRKIKDKLYFLKYWWQTVFSYPQDVISPVTDYDSYWEKRGEDKKKSQAPLLNSWQKNRAEIIAEIINGGGHEKVSILDIGCGDGELLHHLSSLVSVGKVSGADSSSSALALAKKLGIDGIKTNVEKKESIEELPPSDLVMLLEVLEHLPNSEEVLGAAFRVARRGLFFSFPNSGYFLFRLRLLFGKFPMQWRVHPGEHLRFWTLRDLKWWLRAQGYVNYSIHPYQGLPILNKLFPSLFAAGVVVYIRKNND